MSDDEGYVRHPDEEHFHPGDVGDSTVVGQRHHRPRLLTVDRTGKRRAKPHPRPRDRPRPSKTLVDLQSEFARRHTTIRQETGGDPVTILNRLLSTLQESGIPGPQLFRLHKEFCKPLGQGGQGNVRAITDEAARDYHRFESQQVHKSWPVMRIAIKQHLEIKSGEAQRKKFNQKDLCYRFRAAECEVLALAPGLFHNHPNIVKLVGWGLCLDTVEDPGSPCCGGLQLPLLVFERADMNLAQYLQDLFTDGDDSEFEEFEESLMEEGFAASSQSFPSTSPAQGILNLFWKTKASHELQVYELVRRLCIDIGHGLQSLHENNFTHGDLKPENVLIFQYADKVTAKLCDFGCAKGPSQDPSIVKKDDIAIDKQGIEAKAGKTKDSYLGTPGWIPPSSEVRAAHDFDGLRRCDLYVYGLVVCSSFLFAGRPYPTHPNLDSMLSHLRQLETPGRNIPFSWKRSKRRIFDQVTRVLEDTMKAPEERGLFPWRLFGFHHKQLRKQTTESDQDFVSRFKIWLRGSKRGSPGTDLSLETKAAYAQQDWWKLVPDGCSKSGTTSSQSTSMETPTNTPAGTNGNNQPGPASYFLFDEDNSCHKTDMFKTGRRKEDAMQLPGLMISAILKLDADRGKLYYLARFRSRVPKEWWKHYAPNILQMALQAAPAVDIHTLAWLCRGPIGKAEVRSLQADRMTWGHIMTRGELDESSRLDRFLLLLQFGAHIDQRMEGQHGKTKSIYTAFLKSFPSLPAITNTLSMQVIWRVDDAMADNRIRLPKWTYSYVAHVIRNPNSSMVDQSERSPLVELPIGWRVIRQKLTEPELICYKDMFTQSMTLTKPKVSLLQMRQLPIGLLQVPLEGLTCHVDLLACMRAGSGTEEAGSLARRLDARFPYYGDAWFETEFSIEPNVDDVLGAMSNSRIRSFVARLGIFRGYDAAFMTGLFLMSVCLTGLTILAVRLMIHRKSEGGI